MHTFGHVLLIMLKRLINFQCFIEMLMFIFSSSLLFSLPFRLCIHFSLSFIQSFHRIWIFVPFVIAVDVVGCLLLLDAVVQASHSSTPSLMYVYIQFCMLLVCTVHIVFCLLHAQPTKIAEKRCRNTTNQLLVSGVDPKRLATLTRFDECLRITDDWLMIIRNSISYHFLGHVFFVGRLLVMSLFRSIPHLSINILNQKT